MNEGRDQGSEKLSGHEGVRNAITETSRGDDRPDGAVRRRRGCAGGIRAESESAGGAGIAKGWSVRSADPKTGDRAGVAEQQRDSSGEDSGQRGGSCRADY